MTIVQRTTTITTGLVGAHFRPPAKAILQALGAAHPLVLIREPANDYDPHAIMVVLLTESLSEAHLNDIDTLAAEYGHSAESVKAKPYWHIGYCASRNPKGKSYEWLAPVIAPKLDALGLATTDEPLAATLGFTADGDYTVTINLPEVGA